MDTIAAATNKTIEVADMVIQVANTVIQTTDKILEAVEKVAVIIWKMKFLLEGIISMSQFIARLWGGICGRNRIN